MAARTLPYSLGLFSVLREILYTLSRVTEDPLAAPFAPSFESLRVEWKEVLHEEIDILDGIARADATADRVDTTIDAFATKVSRTVDDNSTGPTRKRLRQALFKGKPLSKFSRPVLGSQLDAMTDWATTFAESGISQVAALVSEYEPLILLGKQADDKRKAALKRNRDFRDIGRRKQFIDKLNAKRQETAGILAKLPFEHPELSSDYADGFFAREAPRDDEPTIDEVKESILTLESRIAEQRALLKKLEDEAEAERQAEAARLAQATQAEELEAQAKALLEQAAELKKRATKK